MNEQNPYLMTREQLEHHVEQLYRERDALRTIRDGWISHAVAAQRRARRYRLAWQSARQRAGNLHEALVAADGDRDRLNTLTDEMAAMKLELATVRGLTASAFLGEETEAGHE